MRSKLSPIIRLSAIWLTLNAGVAAATDYTWSGGGVDANWTTAANWGGAGYPNGNEDNVSFTNVANVTLNADVTTKLISLNSGGSTVTVSGTNTITLSPTAVLAFLAQNINDRLVIGPKVVKASASNPNDRVYCNSATNYLGTVVFQNTVRINDSGAAFVIANGTLEFSGDAVLCIVGTPSWAKLMMCMNPVSGGVVTCRLADRASLKLAYLDTSANVIGSGRMYQDGTGTTVSVSKDLNIGDSDVINHGGNVTSPRNYYTLNNGSLTVGTLYCGLKVPGTFLMTNGTLTATKIIVGSLVSTCEFRMTGGHLYLGSNGISLSNSASLLLGGGTVHMTNTAWASDAALTLTGEGGNTAFETAGNTATLSGTLSGSGGLVKTGAGTLTLNGVCAFKGKLNAATGTVNFGTGAFISGVSEIIATNGMVTFESVTASKHRNPHYLETLRVTSGKLTLNASVVVYVSTYIVDGVTQPVGSYLAGSGWVKVANFWTGNGADDNWTNPDNWSGGNCPTGLTSIAYFTNSATVALVSDVIVGRTILNGKGATVTLTGAAYTYKVGNNIDAHYLSLLSLNTNDWLVFQTKLSMFNSSDRLYCNPSSNHLGSVEFENTVRINNNGPDFLFNNGTLVLSGDAAVESSSTTASGMFMAQTTPPGSVVTCRLADRASLKLNFLEVNTTPTVAGRVYQDGTGTVVNLSRQLVVGDSALAHAGTSASPMNDYNLNNGRLTAGSLYVGFKVPGRFVMTNGTLTATKIIVGTLVSTCEFKMTGGHLYPGSNGISLSNSASMLLGGGTVHVTNAAWASDAALTLTGEGGNTVFETAGNSAALSGTLSGAGGLVKAGAGTLTLGGVNSFTGGMSVAGGTLAISSTVANATNLVVSSGAVLSLGSAGALPANTAVAVAAGGVLNLAFSGTLNVDTLVVNGVAKSPGTYTSANAFITGAGSLHVQYGPPRPGTLIRVR